MTSVPIAPPQTVAATVSHRPARSIDRVARIGGLAYLAMFVSAIFSNFVVIEGMVHSGDPGATLTAIEGSLGLFRAGVVGFLAIAVLDVVIAWSLHVLLRTVDADLSLGAAWLRTAYAAVLAVGVAPLFRVVQLVSGTGVAGDLGDAVGTQVMVALSSFQTTWMLGLALFGVHLCVVGRLLVRSGSVSRVLGWMLVVAGAAYALDTVLRVVLGDYSVIAPVMLAVVAVPSMVGEAWLGGWMAFGRRLRG